MRLQHLHCGRDCQAYTGGLCAAAAPLFGLARATVAMHATDPLASLSCCLLTSPCQVLKVAKTLGVALVVRGRVSSVGAVCGGPSQVSTSALNLW